MPLGETLRALSDPNRRIILTNLRRGDQPVSEILEKLDISGASLSHHLATLKKADLVSARREGQQIIYSLNLSVFEEMVKEINDLLN